MRGCWKPTARNTVELKCKAEGRPMPVISWILANRTQVMGQNTEKGRASVSAVGTLVIKDVSVYDRGHYKCIASNPAGADTATVRLQVVAAPPGIMEEKRQQLQAILGHSLQLPCTGHGTPQPSVHWVLHDGSMIQSNRPVSDTRISMYENGTLHIKDVTPAESGKYECIATSSTGSERRVVTLTVILQESAPQILEISKGIIRSISGESLFLHCLSDGSPRPRIYWTVPGGHTLTRPQDTTLHDRGNYICRARNDAGEAVLSVPVIVIAYPPRITMGTQTGK
uniref:Ig-like domain-containing protein n=1 Tax=Oreochromis aureus TaxID=47969 RepID=A0A668RK69_OREAU